MNQFKKGQIVYGKVLGKFIVVKSEMSSVIGEILTVKEIGPNGEQSATKMRFPAEMMKSE